MKFWRLMGEYDAESTTYTEFAGTHGSSPYKPDFNGKLVGLRVVPGRSAATTLLNGVNIKLTSNSFRPSVIECGCHGSGLQTAPAIQAEAMDWSCDQPISANINITLEGKNITADTPVTASVFLYGLFEMS